MTFEQDFVRVIIVLTPSAGVVALGFGLARAQRLPAPTSLAPLVTDVATPCLVFSVFANMRLDPSALARMMLATVACLLVFAILFVSVLGAARLRVRTYLGPLSFPNTGNLGIPVSAAAFGPIGVTYATVFYAISSLANCIFGQALAAGSIDWRRIGRMPLLYAGILGAGVSSMHIAPPEPVRQMISLVGQMAIPLMLLMLGAAVASLRPANTCRPCILAFLRLSLGAIVGYVIAKAFGLSGIPSAILITQAAMPVAVNSYLFAQRWDCEPAEVAAMVAASTLGSCATIPIILAALNF